MRTIWRAAVAVLAVAAAPQARYEAMTQEIRDRTPEGRSAGAREMRHHAGEG